MMKKDMERLRTRLWNLLGDLPKRTDGVKAVKIDESERDGYILETLTLDLNGIEPVPAYFAKPKSKRGKPCATILYNHAHGGDYELGKKEFVNARSGIQPTPYAVEFTRLGYNALCIDTWCFGERRGVTESARFKEMLWKGQVLWGMMVYDSARSLDYLATRGDVDMSRIGTIGLSMGSTMAWWLAALDERVKVCVDICCLTEFETLIRKNGLDGHSIYYYVPSLLKHFDTASINELISPRPHLSIAGVHDPLTPPEGLDIVDARLMKRYAEDGAPGKWRLSRHQTGHYETAAMRRDAIDFLKAHL